MESSSVRTAQKNLARSKKRTDTAVDLDDRNILVKDADIWNGRGFTAGSILIEEGRIKRVTRRITDLSVRTIDASGLKALPGLIDVHVHLRDMGLSYKEDFATGTAAAAAGGFTTVLDMPNTLPPTDSARRLIEKQKVAAQKTYVNVGFHAAAVSDSHDIESLAVAGAFSLKLYLPKPIAPLDIESDQAIEKMMRGAGRVETPVTVHAEDLAGPEINSQGDSFEELAQARSPIFETRAVDRLLRIQEKDQSASSSPPGVPGLETTLPLMLTLVNRQQMDLSLLVKLLCENPARIFGLKSKAKLRRGADGDVVLVDLKRKSRVDSSKFFSKAKFSPFDGFKTQGAVHSTIVGGRVVYREGAVVTGEGSGFVLRRGLSGWGL